MKTYGSKDKVYKSGLTTPSFTQTNSALYLFYLFGLSLINAFAKNCFNAKLLLFLSAHNHTFYFPNNPVAIEIWWPPSKFLLIYTACPLASEECPFFYSRLMPLFRLDLISFSFPLSFYAINFPFSY